MKKILLTTLLFIPLLLSAQTIESFEGTWTMPTGTVGAGGPAGWAIANISGPQQIWQLGTDSSYAGNHHAVISPEDVAPGTFAEDWLISPAITVPANGVLTFYSKLAQPGDQGNTLKVLINTASSPGSQLNTANYMPLQTWTEPQINPVQNQWTQQTVALPAFVGQVVYIAFVAQGNDGDSWMIDNVNVTESCPQPTNIAFYNIGITTATVSWVGTAASYMVEIVPFNAPPTGVGIPVSTNSYTFTGLVEEQYKVYIWSVCGDGIISVPAGPVILQMPLCAPDYQCIYTFILNDTGGDGWNGNTMSLVQNGITVSTLALNSGGSQTVVVPLCGDIPFQLYWNEGGQNAEEVGIQVVNSFEQTVYQKNPGEGTPNTLLYQALTFCYADGCPVPYFVTATTAGTSATVSWSEGPTGLWDYYVAEAGGEAPDNDTTPTGDATTNPFTINNLEPETSYAVYVRTNCADMGGAFNTAWSEPAYFTIGTGNFIAGTVSLDANGDGQCNASDFGIPGVEVVATIGSGSPVSAYTNMEGAYIIDNIAQGTDVQITIQVIVPEGFAPLEPVNLELDFPQSTPAEVNTCLPLPEGIESDIAVILTPLNNPQAGFEAQYAVIVQNNSPIPATGVTVTLDYPADNVSFVAATTGSTAIDGNTITLSLNDIGPFGYDIAGLVFTVLAPPVNIGGETLELTAVVDMAADDANAGNNVSVVNQTVVNAYDPNDITVHEGSFVHIDQADEYLHYTIRFQNTGTAPAVNIRIENELDANLDWDTFGPIGASHDYTVTRREGNLLEFVFENIFLADSTSNEPASHGFVTYRVKPKADIAVNDMVSSTAGIYFDFNEPVITNTATTTFGVLSLPNNQEKRISIYPNPVTDELHIAVAQGLLQHVEIYDLNGRLCHSTGAQHSINTQQLSPGLYILKVKTDTGTSSFKLIKQ